MDLVIKRSEWLRGEKYNSFLIRPSDNKKCCLGFLGLACKVPSKVMIGMSCPESLRYEKQRKKFPALYFRESNPILLRSDIGDQIVTINDREDLSDSAREALLIELFKKIDVNVVFED